MRALKVLIVDDEPLAVRRLQIALAQVADVEVVGVAVHGGAALEQIESLTPDVILLDVKMPILGGFDVLAASPAARRAAVIFVTAYNRYAVKAFEAAAVDYLVKPVEFGRLAEALARARERLEAGHLRREFADLKLAMNGASSLPEQTADDLWIRERGGATRLPLQDVELFAAEGDYVRAHTASRSYLLNDTLSELAARFERRGFIRVHRSALARISAIRKLGRRPSGGLEVTLQSGRSVPVGRGREAEVLRMARQD